MTSEKKQEYTLKITQANKTQMITILYEMVIDYISDAEAAMTNGQRDIADRNLLYAQNVIDELIRSVNLKMDTGDGSLCPTFFFFWDTGWDTGDGSLCPKIHFLPDSFISFSKASGFLR